MRRAAWYAKTHIFPIMHTLVIRRDVYEGNRWLARAHYDAFAKAKDIAMKRFRPPSRGTTMPWLASHAQGVMSLMGEDWWPYGIASNRHTLETFARYHNKQGLTRRRLQIEELFAPETLGD
jgi:4,5-dihydroxyphthalate decarboxylase